MPIISETAAPTETGTNPATRSDGGEPSKSYRDFSYAKSVIDKVIDGFQITVVETERGRQFRWLRDINGHRLRSMGILRAGQGFYPVPMADIKIRKEQPPYLEFLTQSQRSAIFELPDGSNFPDSERLEAFFTNCCRYLGWSTPFIQWIDGVQAFGWDCLEIVFDPSKPGNFNFERVGRENLPINVNVEAIESQEVFPRTVCLTPYQLEQFVKTNGFNAEVVKKLIDSSPDRNNDNPRLSVIKVQKTFFKEKGIVWSAWYHKMAQDWIKEPEPLYLGRRDVGKPQVDSGERDELGNPVMVHPPIYETEYPFILLRYTESEDPRITMTKGRVELDEAAQEGITVLNSALINKEYRASFLQASPKPGPSMAGTNGQPKQLDTPVMDGQIWNTPMDFSYFPGATLGQMGIIERQMSLSYSADSQVNYAALNRPDTEKTATEITQAKEESNKLSGVQITLLSDALRLAYTKAFSIVQNRVAQGLIKVSQGLFNLMVEQVSGLSGRPTLMRLKPYTLKSSGDVDVIKRAETFKTRKEFWPIILQIIQAGPVVLNNPLAAAYLTDLFCSAFPEDGDKYMLAFQQQAATASIVDKLSQLVQELATDDTGNLRPELQAQAPKIQALLQSAQTAFLGSPAGKLQMSASSNQPKQLGQMKTTQQNNAHPASLQGGRL